MSDPDRTGERSLSRAAVIGSFLTAGGIAYGFARPAGAQEQAGVAIVGGTVEAVSADAVTISTVGGSVRVIGRHATPQALASRTRQHRLEQGAEVVAAGTRSPDGTFVATEIAPLFREVSGRVDSLTREDVVIGGVSLDINSETTFEPVYDQAQVGPSARRPDSLSVGSSVAALAIKRPRSGRLEAARIYV